MKMIWLTYIKWLDARMRTANDYNAALLAEKIIRVCERCRSPLDDALCAKALLCIFRHHQDEGTLPTFIRALEAKVNKYQGTALAEIFFIHYTAAKECYEQDMKGACA